MPLVPTIVDTVVGSPIRLADAVVDTSLDTVGLFADHDPESLESTYCDEHSRFVEVAGSQVHYRDEGSGPTLLLLHGTFSSLHTWDAWTERLADDYQVVAVDLPGHGLTGPHEGFAYGMDGLTAFVEAFCETVGLEDVAIVGNSRGGGIAWRYVLDYDRAERLVLVDAMGFPMDPPTPLIRLLALPGVSVGPRWLTPEWLAASVLDQVYGDPDRIDPGTVRRYHDLLLHRGNRRALVDILRRDLQGDHRFDELPEVDVPTLVLWGELDEWLPASMARRFCEEIPDTECVVYEGVGHAPMEEIPDWSASDLEAFLDDWRPPVSVPVRAPAEEATP